MKRVLLLVIIAIPSLLLGQRTGRALIDSLNGALANANTDTSRCRLMADISIEYENINPDSGLAIAKKALELGKEIESERAIAFANRALGLLYNSKSNFPEGVSFTMNALKYFEEKNETYFEARCLQIMGEGLAQQKKFDEAFKYFKNAYGLDSAINNIKGMGADLMNMGTLNLEHHTEEGTLVARQYYERAYAVLKNTDFNQEKVRTLSNLSITYSRLFDFIKSVQLLKDAMVFAEQIEDKTSSGFLYYLIGSSYNNIANKVKEGVKDIKLPPDVSSIRSAQLKAKEYMQQAIDIYESLGNGLWLSRCYKNLSTISMNLGDFKEAFYSYRTSVDYRDSIYSEENKKKIEALIQQRDEDVKQKQIELQHVQLAAARKEKIFYIIGAVILVMASLSFQVIRTRIINIRKQAQQRVQNAEAEMKALRAQLNPHFMFNSLNAIQELILMEENEKSQTYLARFSKLLRMLLENADKPFIPLQREIDFLQLYLSLENLRIPDLRFSIEIDPSIDTAKTLIPNMILQPYIENAIWHGLSHKQNDRELKLKIYMQNGVVIYDVIDNGVGREKSAELKSLYRKEHKSKGMELLSRRFKLLSEEFGSDIVTEINDVVDNGVVNGTLVSIKIPVKLTKDFKETVI